MFALLLAAQGPFIQPYDIIDARFCELTPRPFLCESCLRRGFVFARYLSFADGRPVRIFGCLQPDKKADPN